jgi:peptidoglycan/xylan/chitin deacetylase (PgdA/CDA1 family)
MCPSNEMIGQAFRAMLRHSRPRADPRSSEATLRLHLRFCLIPLFFAACSGDEPPDDATTGGTGNVAGSTAGKGGSSAGQSGKGGTGTGGTAATAGSSAAGNAGMGGTGTAGGSGTGAAGGSGTAGTGALGGAAGSAGSSAGAAAMGGGAGAATGGASGTGGVSGSGGSGGGGNPPPPSGLPVPPGDANQPRPSGTPDDIEVINWAGFKSALTYTFDDNNTTQIQRYPEMQALGVPFTFFLWTGKSEATNAVWTMAKADGHELANHTQSHQSNGTGEDIDTAQAFIMQRFSLTAYTMAAPNGAGVYTDLAKPRFMINRGVSNKIIAPNDNSDPFTLPTYIPPTGASTNAFNQEVDSARSAGGWRTMCIHGFQGGNDGAYQPVPFDQWKASVEYAKGLGDVWIGTMEDIGAYWLGQKAFSDATKTTAGTDQTWTWELPDHFPPGKFLRVKVAGGTLKQAGAELAWHGNGYYEIALDAGSVTLSP